MVKKKLVTGVHRIAVLFPGQGAQYVGMGRDFYEDYRPAEEVFERAADILGPGLIEAIFKGPEEKLKQTEYAQPAILTVSTAIHAVIASLGIKAEAYAGLSLGEYSALVAAGSLSFDQALPLVQKRGMFMQEAVPAGMGKMAAIMGLPHEMVEKICLEVSGDSFDDRFVSPANYNCPGQIVVSGSNSGVSCAVQMAREAGARRVTELKVSAPFHCALLKPVEALMAAELEKIHVKETSVEVISNVTAEPVSHPGTIKENLVVQVSNPILWDRSVRFLVERGVNTFIGFGPGTSLVRLMKRIDPGVEAIAVETVDDLKHLSRVTG